MTQPTACTRAQLEAAHAELDALASTDAQDVAARLGKLANIIASWHATQPDVLDVGRAAARAALTGLLRKAQATVEQVRAAQAEQAQAEQAEQERGRA